MGLFTDSKYYSKNGKHDAKNIMTATQKESYAKKYAMYAKHEFKNRGGAKKYTGEGYFPAKLDLQYSYFYGSDYSKSWSKKYNAVVDDEDRLKFARKTCTILHKAGYKTEPEIFRFEKKPVKRAIKKR